MLGHELFHESDEIVNMELHGPGILLTIASYETVAGANLRIQNKQIGEFIPRVWVVSQCWNTACCFIDFELVGSHWTKEISACGAALLPSHPNYEWIFVPIVSGLEQHIEHVLAGFIVNGIVPGIKHIIFQTHLFRNGIIPWYFLL